MTASTTTNKVSPKVRERAVPMLLEQAGDHPTRWAAAVSVAAKIGCAAQPLTKAGRQLRAGACCHA